MGLFYEEEKYSNHKDKNEFVNMRAIELFMSSMSSKELEIQIKNGYIYFAHDSVKTKFIDPNVENVAKTLGNRGLLPKGERINEKYFNFRERKIETFQPTSPEIDIKIFFGCPKIYKKFELSYIDHQFGGHSAGDAPVHHERQYYITLA